MFTAEDVVAKKARLWCRLHRPRSRRSLRWRNKALQLEETSWSPRSFNKMNRFDGPNDAWRDWALLLMSYIQTVSPALKNGIEHARFRGTRVSRT